MNLLSVSSKTPSALKRVLFNAVKPDDIVKKQSNIIHCGYRNIIRGPEYKCMERETINYSFKQLNYWSTYIYNEDGTVKKLIDRAFRSDGTLAKSIDWIKGVMKIEKVFDGSGKKVLKTVITDGTADF